MSWQKHYVFHYNNVTIRNVTIESSQIEICSRSPTVSLTSKISLSYSICNMKNLLYHSGIIISPLHFIFPHYHNKNRIKKNLLFHTSHNTKPPVLGDTCTLFYHWTFVLKTKSTWGHLHSVLLFDICQILAFVHKYGIYSLACGWHLSGIQLKY